MSFRATVVILMCLLITMSNSQRPVGNWLTNVGDVFGYDVFRRPRIVLRLPATIQLAPIAPAPAPAAPAPAPGPAAGPAPAPAAASQLDFPFANWIVG